MTTAHYVISDARRQSSRLEIAVTIYALLGVIGSIALFGNEMPGLGFVGLLTTALTAGCAGALVQIVRLLAVIAERDLPPLPPAPARQPGRLATAISGAGVVMLLSIVVGGVLIAIVIAALVS